VSKLRPSGGYRDSVSFQTATLIYDATYWFCEKFLDPHSRTVDQMVQAARSGRQNIAEGSRAAATSSQTELRLLNVARASLEELLLDFEDFLRHRRFPQWAPDSPEAQEVRQVPQRFPQDRSDQSDLTNLSDQERWALYAPWLDHADPAVRANALICLIHQANFLLDQQIAALEKPSSRVAATASNSPPRAWPTGPSGIGPIGRIRLIRPISSPTAPNAASPWPSARPKPEKTPATSSGAARHIPIAKEPPRYESRPSPPTHQGDLHPAVRPRPLPPLCNQCPEPHGRVEERLHAGAGRLRCPCEKLSAPGHLC